MDDYFAVFGLPRKLQVDLDGLQRRFYELSRQHHPDFHQMARPDEQAVALERSALVNRAYRALRDPLARVEYLIALEEGGEVKEGASVKPKAPMNLLEEMLEVQESLQAAKGAGLDEPSRARLAEERKSLVMRQAAGEAGVIERFAEWDRTAGAGGDTTPLRRWLNEALATRAYLRTVIDDLSEALGEDQDAHASHRRH